MTRKIIVGTDHRTVSYPVEVSSGLITDRSGATIIEFLGRCPKKSVIVSNRKVFSLYGGSLVPSLSAAGSEVSAHLIGDGERFKNLRTLERALEFFGENELGRTDAVIALGGGVVGDLAGFAASIYLRGIDLVQVPTTLLSMIDSSVGGKTAVNSRFGKNSIGSFYQPRGVIVDPQVISTLPRREIRAGLFEAVKQAALSGETLLEATLSMIDELNERPTVGPNCTQRMGGIEGGLASHIKFKADIVAADEREQTSRTDPRSRKILNFGHTFGHALEKVTKYRYLLHGEAVGYGLLFASALSKNLGLLSNNELKLLYDVVHRVGRKPPIDKIDPREIFATFRFDKKRIDDSVQWILLEGIGRPVIIPHSQIPEAALLTAYKQAVQN